MFKGLQQAQESCARVHDGSQEATSKLKVKDEVLPPKRQGSLPSSSCPFDSKQMTGLCRMGHLFSGTPSSHTQSCADPVYLDISYSSQHNCLIVTEDNIGV